ncbi:hypothetical protein C6I21_11300 [Alkalicoccus urumqiensis]|uniref:Uncharacterized protein n=1 Tax=Alkalicoccus urumqiensis TaxID=1548213 RepID=A0A2P6MFH9_ALKUR|nr:hypothetical protein C6I21_11300 [Alkalicoccus urumqiensis]
MKNEVECEDGDEAAKPLAREKLPRLKEVLQEEGCRLLLSAGKNLPDGTRYVLREADVVCNQGGTAVINLVPMSKDRGGIFLWCAPRLVNAARKRRKWS